MKSKKILNLFILLLVFLFLPGLIHAEKVKLRVTALATCSTTISVMILEPWTLMCKNMKAVTAVFFLFLVGQSSFNPPRAN